MKRFDWDRYYKMKEMEQNGFSLTMISFVFGIAESTAKQAIEKGDELSRLKKENVWHVDLSARAVWSVRSACHLWKNESSEEARRRIKNQIKSKEGLVVYRDFGEKTAKELEQYLGMSLVVYSANDGTCKKIVKEG